MAENEGVLVFAEVNNGKLTAAARESLGVGTRLGGGVSAVVIGKDTEAVAKELVAFGAGKVYTYEDEELAGYQPDAYLQLLEQAIAADGPPTCESRIGIARARPTTIRIPLATSV